MDPFFKVVRHRAFVSGARPLCFAVLMLMSCLQAHAQSDIDVEPPIVEHEQVETGRAGVVQEFTATVVDDRALAEVLLFYRFAGEDTFENVPMLAVGGTSLFTATVATGSGDTRAIEYYIQARDQAGNRVIKGYAFSPLVRSMGSAAPVARPVVEEGPRIRRGWLYAGIGVLAAGAIAYYVSRELENDPEPGPSDFLLIIEQPE